LLLPFFACLLAFWLVPLLRGLGMSLESNTIFGEARHVGWANYRELLADGRFFVALKNTALYTAWSVGILLPLATWLALGLHGMPRRVRSVLSFCLMLPGLTPPAVLAVLFHLVFHGRSGVLNQWFVLPFGWQPIQWMTDPNFILPALVFQAVWRWTGFIAFFVLAAMESIPASRYEAAWLESNSRGRVFWRVTLPALRPVLLFSGVYLVVDAVAMFSGAYVLLGPSGGTADAGLVLVSFIYQTAFTFGKFGTAAAVGVVVVPLLLAWLGMCVAVNRRLQKDTA
jgi:ABC-type sugar transport system permease subunit